MSRLIFQCDCLYCESGSQHGERDCDNEVHYYVEMHAVDNCHEFEGGKMCAALCLECFDSYVRSINKIIADGMNGERPPLCQGQGCDRYLVRMHNFLDQIQPADSYLAEVQSAAALRMELEETS